MPPDKRTGRAVRAAPRKTAPTDRCASSQYRRPWAAPMAAPTAGRKQIHQRMLFSFHSVCGTGILEYKEKAMKKEVSIP